MPIAGVAQMALPNLCSHRPEECQMDPSETVPEQLHRPSAPNTAATQLTERPSDGLYQMYSIL